MKKRIKYKELNNKERHVLTFPSRNYFSIRYLSRRIGNLKGSQEKRSRLNIVCSNSPRASVDRTLNSCGSKARCARPGPRSIKGMGHSTRCGEWRASMAITSANKPGDEYTVKLAAGCTMNRPLHVDNSNPPSGN